MLLRIEDSRIVLRRIGMDWSPIQESAFHSFLSTYSFPIKWLFFGTMFPDNKINPYILPCGEEISGVRQKKGMNTKSSSFDELSEKG
jgi:hypothetical protein